MLGAAATVMGVQADDSTPMKVTECGLDCVQVDSWQFSLGVGVGLRESPINGVDDTPLVVLPELSYYGKRFFLRNFEFGWTLHENPRHQTNLLVIPGYDQMYFDRWNPLNFSDPGGFTAAVTSAAAPASFAANVQVVSLGGGGGETPPPPPGDPATGDPATGGDPPSGGDGDNGSGSDGFEGDSSELTLTLNGQAIEPTRGGVSVTGAEGNTVTFMLTDTGFNITGLSPADSVYMEGEVVMDQNVAGEAERANGEDVAVNDYSSVRMTSAAEQNAQAEEVTADSVASRKLAGLAGVEYLYSREHFQFHVQGLTDVTSVHRGQEVRVAMIFPWAMGSHRMALTLGANWQSEDILDYYYGVDTRDTNVTSLFYQPSSPGIGKMVRLDWQKTLSRHWSLRAMVQHRMLADEVRASPLVAQPDFTAFFFGGVYHF